MHGIVTTYQQVASNPEALRPLAAAVAFVILDEVHHAGDERAWGDAVRRAFEVSPRRLSLSGTPFRSDTRAIPFVRYVLDEARPDFEYGYGDALADGRVVRPVYFPRINGLHGVGRRPTARPTPPASTTPSTAPRSAQRLRTALSLEGEWLPTVLRQADERLAGIREVQPDAGGLVIATDQDHAQGIADILRYRCGRKATVGDVRRPARLGPDRRSSPTGTDAVDRGRAHGVGGRRHPPPAGRRVRHDHHHRAVLPPGRRAVRALDAGACPGQKAYLFIPDDPRLRTWADQIADAAPAQPAQARGGRADERAARRRLGVRRAPPRGRQGRAAVDVRRPVGAW